MAPTLMTDYSRPTTPENGTNGLSSPRTPKQTGLALTEYTANPSPTGENHKVAAREAIPEAFLLPNGYPDVRTVFYVEFEIYVQKKLTQLEVSTFNPHVSRV